MRAFVSGGAGFIGSNLVRELLAQPDADSVTVYDNFTSGQERHLDFCRHDSKLTVVNGDIKQLESLTDAMRGSDLVFHLAANPDIAKAASQPDIDFWEGTYLTQNVLEAMRVNGVPRIVYASGSGVYGDLPGMSFSESFGPCIPISTYGASKLACEALIASYCHMFGITARVFRFANVVGPHQTHGVGFDFIRRLRNDPEVLPILGDGRQLKSYIHVDDVLAAIFLILRSAVVVPSFDVFNVATDDQLTVTEIADLACTVVGIDPTSVVYAYSGGDRGWKGDVPRVLFDVSKLKTHGWSARRTSRQAIRDALEAMLDEL
jgi:UDP-glucose 4-epimerase